MLVVLSCYFLHNHSLPSFHDLLMVTPPLCMLFALFTQLTCPHFLGFSNVNNDNNGNTAQWLSFIKPLLWVRCSIKLSAYILHPLSRNHIGSVWIHSPHSSLVLCWHQIVDVVEGSWIQDPECLGSTSDQLCGYKAVFLNDFVPLLLICKMGITKVPMFKVNPRLNEDLI